MAGGRHSAASCFAVCISTRNSKQYSPLQNGGLSSLTANAFCWEQKILPWLLFVSFRWLRWLLIASEAETDSIYAGISLFVFWTIQRIFIGQKWSPLAPHRNNVSVTWSMSLKENYWKTPLKKPCGIQPLTARQSCKDPSPLSSFLSDLSLLFTGEWKVFNLIIC